MPVSIKDGNYAPDFDLGCHDVDLGLVYQALSTNDVM